MGQKRAKDFGDEVLIPQIREGLDAGKSGTQIAREIGVSDYTLYRIVKQNGLKLPNARMSKSMRRDLMARSGVSVGALGAELDRHERDFKEWLISGVPAGSTLAAFVMSLALDAYHEEKDGKS